MLQHQNGHQLENGKSSNETQSSHPNSNNNDKPQPEYGPDAICFVDWQFSNYNSPALDLLYYIFTATDKRLRDAEYDELLLCYHDTLSATIRLLGNDPERLYPYAVMLEQLRIFGAFTYSMIPWALDTALADPGDIVHFDEIISEKPINDENGTSPQNGVNANGEKVRKDFLNDFRNEATRNVYQKRIFEIASDLIELNYISDHSKSDSNAANGH